MKTFKFKTGFVLVLLILLPSFSLSAMPEFTLSAGGGVNLVGFFSNYTISANETNSDSNEVWMNLDQKMRQFNVGFYLYIDSTFAILSVDFQKGFNSYNEGGIISVGTSRVDPAPIEGNGKETTIGIVLLAKYPVQFRKNFVIYPLAGMSWRIAIAEKRTPEGGREYNRTDGTTEFNQFGDYELSMWNSWLINIGAGMDLFLKEPFYLRTELIYSVRLMTKYEKAALDWLMDTYKISQPKLFASPGMTGLTHGPELRLALGYRLN